MRVRFALIVAVTISVGVLAPVWADDDDLIFDGDTQVTPGGKPSAAPQDARSGSTGTGSVSTPVRPTGNRSTTGRPAGGGRGAGNNAASGAFESDDPLDADFGSTKGNLTQRGVESSIDKKVANSEARIERKMALAEADVELYEQMVRIAGWLTQYSVWNRHWPDPGDQENDAIRQLNDLCPNNPYKSAKLQEAEGFSTDPIYNYYSPTVNQIPDAASGYEGDSVEPTTTAGALGPKRIRLVLDPSLTGTQADIWKESPPADWIATPGTITAICNNTDLILLWGAGINGKPLKVPGQNRARLFVSTVKMETSAPQY